MNNQGTQQTKRFKLGLIINPFAGIGGRVGLKGSDGDAIRQQALAMGAPKLAPQRAAIALSQLESCAGQFEVYTVSSEMGETTCQQLGLPYQVVYQAAQPSTDADTRAAVKALQQKGVDLILFAGGDGTARNVFEDCGESQMVLGIPAGVKIHSGVYAISPQAAGLLVAKLVQGQLLSLLTADVMDIDEAAFRQGTVKARKYGYLNVPGALEYVQSTKSGGVEVESMVLDDIAAEVIESMDDETYYVVGSGSTCAAIMEAMQLDNTLLGLDIVYQHRVYQADATEADLLALLEQKVKIKFFITVIGGQGHILGRGNQQISPAVIKETGWDNFTLVATKQKLKQLNGRPLLVDTGDAELDAQLSGTKSVITGYRDFALYPVGFAPPDQ